MVGAGQRQLEKLQKGIYSWILNVLYPTAVALQDRQYLSLSTIAKMDQLLYNEELISFLAIYIHVEMSIHTGCTLHVTNALRKCVCLSKK